MAKKQVRNDFEFDFFSSMVMVTAHTDRAKFYVKATDPAKVLKWIGSSFSYEPAKAREFMNTLHSEGFSVGSNR